MYCQNVNDYLPYSAWSEEVVVEPRLRGLWHRLTLRKPQECETALLSQLDSNGVDYGTDSRSVNLLLWGGGVCF